MEAMDDRLTGLRVLVVAHEYPPMDSPHALRVHHLVRGLLARGHHVCVLTRALPFMGLEVSLPAGLSVVRAQAGMPERVTSWLRKCRMRFFPKNPGNAQNQSVLDRFPRMNWWGRLEAVVTWLSSPLFPGKSRGWGRRIRPVLASCIAGVRPDCVVLSHEPAAALLLIDDCKQAMLPVVAELGDPVCTIYTPARWKRSAFALESRVCRDADKVVVTCEATRQLLAGRHGIDAGMVRVITQGFSAQVRVPKAGARLRLVYTGRLYPFRSPWPLIEAVAAMPAVELVLATPPIGDRQATTVPDNVMILGQLTHEQALELQSSADILVNIANDGLPQVPGKFYEYLGFETPILHVTSRREQKDEQAELVQSGRRGWVVSNQAHEIKRQLDALASLWRQGKLNQGLDLSTSSVMSYAWENIGSAFAEIVEIAAVRPSQARDQVIE